MNRIQVVTCKCGSQIAACVEPNCYIDFEWLRDLKKYIKKGCKIYLIEKQDFEFKSCICKELQEKNEPKLF
jgi:hypothetical protein